MKKVNFRQAMWLIGSLLILIGVAWIFNAGTAAAMGVVKATVIAGAAQTGTGIVTTEVTETASPDLLMSDIEKAIVEMQPEIYPLDTVTRNLMKSTTAEAWKTEFYAVGVRAVEDTITTSQTHAAGGASGDAKYFIVTNINIWNVDDTAIISGVKSGITNEPGELMVYVIAIDRPNKKITCLAINSGTGANVYKMPQIGNGTKITNIGNSKHETDAKTSPVSIFPTKEYNYCQIHMAMVETSAYDKILKKEVQWDINNQAKMNMYAFRQKCELTSLFGVRHELNLAGYDRRYFSGGITRFITNKMEKPSGGIDNAWFNTLSKNLFSGNDGSDTRIYFASPNHMEELMNVPDIQKQMTARESEIVYGVRFKRIETAFGNLLLRMHRGLAFMPTWADRGLILDLNNIQKRVLKPMETRELDQKSSGIKNADSIVIDEAFCMVTHYPDVHMAVVNNGDYL